IVYGCCCLPCGRLGRNEPRFAVRREKSARGKKALLLALTAGPDRPLHRFERIVISIRNSDEPTQVEVAAAVVLECGERGMLAKNIGRTRIGKSFGETHPMRDLRDDPPVRPHFVERAVECALAGDAPL